MKIIRRKDQLNKTWVWKLVHPNPILCMPGKDVYEVISTHKTKADAQAEKERIEKESSPTG